ncbi:MAG: pseudouridine synthase [Bacteroidetes bacterium]|nr:pseudouridine synthase [Bacteroidota bacterium]
MESAGIQINKFISSTGYCSRREADSLVLQGRVEINGEMALPTSRVTKADRIIVDGSLMKHKKQVQHIYLAFNKPIGITSTTDQTDHTNIISYINYPKRIFPIGRLDKDSSGLILLTNNGDIVNEILRSENKHDKEYIVTVDKQIDEVFVQKMSKGVNILGEWTKKCKVVAMGSKKFRIILQQGLNRQIRRMCEALGYHVVSLVRVRIMDITLDKIPVGKWRLLSEVEIAKLEGKTNYSHELDKKGADRFDSKK